MLPDVLCCSNESFDAATSIGKNFAVDQENSSSLATSPTTVEIIDTVASKNERRKAQNRAAQKAFRIRQQQALDDVTKEVKHLKEQLQQANALKDQCQRRFENLARKHERLLQATGKMLGARRMSN
ncbi:hypothetical protein LTR10_020034 [Elasticomyces elasticus]|uniref:BZIP domain-containing protein n=1 Tax=Exophiala sideris TaxID=1016849 RepID=A0ABR0JN43_9EURO|nr:hypothetical protein LTR10_020034 [Elasticomyces elasticus]KAK5037861.1 hypothetical protein LTS07_001328 [Exophiala sideris]KAK5043844.1 hypothetical protein LTR13_000198 [Exophiala sideris]KAK5067343.1 hypothetical protein LTR69_001330 [Exophiala sideris]KAK5182676.1 hypothetical protein LTR44_005067 [Eurotiomycetes sp. CCFEE 6388]